MDVWTVMMNDGNATSKAKGDVLVNKAETSKKFKPVTEIAKLLTCQSDHTFPVIVLSTLERLPIKKPDRMLKMRSELQEEIQSFLGNKKVIKIVFQNKK